MVRQPIEGREQSIQIAMDLDSDAPRPNGASEAVPPVGPSLVRWSIVYLVLIVAVWAFFGAAPQ